MVRVQSSVPPHGLCSKNLKRTCEASKGPPIAGIPYTPDLGADQRLGADQTLQYFWLQVFLIGSQPTPQVGPPTPKACDYRVSQQALEGRYEPASGVLLLSGCGWVGWGVGVNPTADGKHPA